MSSSSQPVRGIDKSNADSKKSEFRPATQLLLNSDNKAGAKRPFSARRDMFELPPQDDQVIVATMNGAEHEHDPAETEQPPTEPNSVETGRGVSSSVTVSTTQEGNPVLSSLRGCPWNYGPTDADYVVGRGSVVLYLTLTYHRLHPDYILRRINRLSSKHSLRILLLNVDVEDYRNNLRELTGTCLATGCALILAWSFEESARYIELFKALETRSPDALRARTETDGEFGGYLSRVVEMLTQVRSVNKTDALTLLATFGTLARIAVARVEQLAACPGIGRKKAQKIWDAFRAPFVYTE